MFALCAPENWVTTRALCSPIIVYLLWMPGKGAKSIWNRYEKVCINHKATAGVLQSQRMSPQFMFFPKFLLCIPSRHARRHDQKTAAAIPEKYWRDQSEKKPYSVLSYLKYWLSAVKKILLSGKMPKKNPDDNHEYGYKSVEIGLHSDPAALWRRASMNQKQNIQCYFQGTLGNK